MSTEVDARLSFDTQATVDKALQIVDLYNQKDTDLSRIYIKVHSNLQFDTAQALMPAFTALQLAIPAMDVIVDIQCRHLAVGPVCYHCDQLYAPTWPDYLMLSAC